MKLVKPTIEYKEMWLDYFNEYTKENNKLAPMGYKKEFIYEEWIQRLEKESKGIDLEEGRVPSDVYFMIDNNIIVGAISIRHRVDNDFLFSFGGHIGYGIRPSQRNKGYGKEILKLGLIKCKELNINKVLVTCLESNIASNKIIISCGGKFENKIFLDAENDYMNRYWIIL